MSTAKIFYTRKEVSLHNKWTDCWIIVHGKVYDVTQWLDKHPGGSKIIFNHAGEDATVPMEVFHSSELPLSYLWQFCIGELVENEKPLKEIEQDFIKLKKTLKQKGLFEPNIIYYITLISVGISSEFLGVLLLWLFPNSWTAWISAVFCAFCCGVVMQELGHDLGHGSGFKNVKFNRLVQNFCLTFIGGQCCSFWNERHNEHHAKTNVVSKDPDVTFPLNAILLGTELPKKVGSQGKGFLPYQYQGIYLSVFFPTVLLTIGFNIKATVYLIKNISNKWMELIWFIMFFVRWHLVYTNMFGSVWSAVCFFCAAKIMQGLWLSLLTQSHHLALEIDAHDKGTDFFTLQVNHCYYLKSSWLVDVASAHTNYHIEHHLFPTMPPHNHYLAKPYVMELCEKYGLKYREISAWKALSCIYGELRKAGEIWLQEYNKALVN